MKKDVLKEICAKKRDDVAHAKKQTPYDVLHEKAQTASPPRGFLNALRQRVARDSCAFITEIKKASPSAGIIRSLFHPSALAKTYENAGATCLSVLTDTPYFQGQNDDLIAARNACTLPVLRKDFILDPWQVAESRAIGADCILLIMAVLTDEQARDLYTLAHDYGMDVLVETHDDDEIKRALTLPAPMIGVNSRNLKTLAIDLDNAARLISTLPRDRFAVSESGLKKPDDIARMKTAGAKAFLIGESLLKSTDIKGSLTALRQA